VVLKFTETFSINAKAFFIRAEVALRSLMMATVAQVFGSTLQRIRTQRGITQRELGAFTRISPTFIGEMERGLKAPNLQVVVAIARALHVGVDEMVAGFPTKQSIREQVIASETPKETEGEGSGRQSA